MTDNGANDQGLTVYGASFDDCIEMLENTADIYALSQSTTALIPRPAESELSIATCPSADAVVAELCNGLDDDCDGLIDEDTDSLNACGGCGMLPAERCDGVDNDCDGIRDVPGCVADEQ